MGSASDSSSPYDANDHTKAWATRNYRAANQRYV